MVGFQRTIHLNTRPTVRSVLRVRQIDGSRESSGGGMAGLRGRLLVLSLFVLLLWTLSGVFVSAQSRMNIQAGVWGDEASVGNIGVRAEIRTHAYALNERDLGDAFWVGDNLDNGGFIQFGYEIESPGRYCVSGQIVGGVEKCSRSDTLSDADARWFWEYFPNLKARDFYFASGAYGSAGSNGTWHQYTITPSTAGGWAFLLDGKQVDGTSLQWTHSKDRVYVVAEKVTSSASPGPLGPVEFRNVAYLKDDGWHGVSQLYVLRGCGVSENCGSNIPYGVELKGPDYFVAGSGQSLLKRGSLLWMKHGATLTIQVPVQVSVSVDNVEQGLGPNVIVELANGTHQVAIPSILDLGNGTRLEFSSWSDGVGAANRTMNVESDIALQATYVTQYLVTVNSGIASPSEQWYNQGSRASYSIPSTTARMDNPLGYLGGKLVFTGWYENGKSGTSSASGSFVVDGPRELDAQWQPDVTLPITILASIVVAGVIVFLVYRRKRGVGPGGPAVSRDEKPLEASSEPGLRANQTPAAHLVTFCRYCGGRIPDESTKCPECGLTVRFLGAD